DFHRFILCLNDSIAARCYRHAGFARSSTSSVLVAHGLHRAGRGPDELDVAALTDLHEMRVLSEKSIAGMTRVNIAYLSRTHDAINSQVTLKTGRRTDADRFISELDVQRIDVCFGIDCERANAEFLTGANHP